MADYLRIKSDGKFFSSILEIEIFNATYRIPCIIDTGCARSTISLRFLLPESEVMKKKRQEIEKQTPYSFSYGVNDTEETRGQDAKITDIEELLASKRIVFQHRFTTFSIGTLHLGERVVRVSYDRTSPILIGMDILKELDIHMGSNREGQHLLLACHKGSLSNAYRQALNYYFGV